MVLKVIEILKEQPEISQDGTPGSVAPISNKILTPAMGSHESGCPSSFAGAESGSCIFVMALQIIQRHDRIMPTFAVGEELASFLGVLIGYITRKGSVLTKYGEAYIEELLKYLLPMDTEEEQ